MFNEIIIVKVNGLVRNHIGFRIVLLVGQILCGYIVLLNVIFLQVILEIVFGFSGRNEPYRNGNIDCDYHE